jgi:hypothetical protein
MHLSRPPVSTTARAAARLARLAALVTAGFAVGTVAGARLAALFDRRQLFPRG